MNNYLISPVTPIVLAVVAVAALIAIVLTVRSNHRKEREWQEERRVMEERVAKRIAAEREGRDRPRHAAPRLPDLRPQLRRKHSTSDPDPAINDTTSALVATGILFDYDPPRHDSGHSSSSYDGGSSSSSSSDSSSSSSDGGSSGGGGGCD